MYLPLSFLEDEYDFDLNIAQAGALIRSAWQEQPICNSKEHKEIGFAEKCQLPICHSEEYKAIGIKQECRAPICGSEQHQAIGLEKNCAEPICNSSDHKTVGLDKECLPACSSEQHKTLGLDTPCRKAYDDDTFVRGSPLANAWMYDGDTWNNIKPISSPREDHMCSLVQTDEGVSIKC